MPVAFIKNGFQVFLKENEFDLGAISGLMGLMLLPWTLKFLWAPLVDRVGFNKKAHRKSWIIPMQVLGTLLLVFAAFSEPQDHLLRICILFFGYSFFCATQDIAVDGLAVLSLNKREHGMGNSMQMGGYYLGELLGGAVLLIVLGTFGWTATILSLAALFLLPLIPLIPFKEPQCPVDNEERPSMKSIADWFKRNEIMWVILLIVYTGNQVLARTLFPSLLTDRNFSETEIGQLVGIWGNGASLVGALLGGLLMNKLGRKNSIILYSILKLAAFSLLFFLLDESLSYQKALFVIATNDFCAGLATVALFTVMMDKCNLNRPGTDFTIQQSINSIGILVFVILSGTIAKAFGYGGLFYAAIIIGVLSVILALFGIKWNKVEVNGGFPEVRGRM